MNGIYPGWQVGEKASLEDPREPQPSIEEPGRGPVSPEIGQFKAVHLWGSTAILEYTVAGEQVLEHITATDFNGTRAVKREFTLSPNARPVVLAIGRKPNQGGADHVSVSASPGDRADRRSRDVECARCAPTKRRRIFTFPSFKGTLPYRT